jgi:hypothetical protein
VGTYSSDSQRREQTLEAGIPPETLARMLGFVDAYRTLCLAPTVALKAVFDDARLAA